MNRTTAADIRAGDQFSARGQQWTASSARWSPHGQLVLVRVEQPRGHELALAADEPVTRYHDCGRCPRPPKGAVDHGCGCDLTREQADRRAAEFLRHHD